MKCCCFLIQIVQYSDIGVQYDTLVLSGNINFLFLVINYLDD